MRKAKAELLAVCFYDMQQQRASRGERSAAAEAAEPRGLSDTAAYARACKRFVLICVYFSSRGKERRRCVRAAGSGACASDYLRMAALLISARACAKAYATRCCSSASYRSLPVTPQLSSSSIRVGAYRLYRAIKSPPSLAFSLHRLRRLYCVLSATALLVILTLPCADAALPDVFCRFLFTLSHRHADKHAILGYAMPSPESEGAFRALIVLLFAVRHALRLR